MKSFIIVAALATLTLSSVAPLQAATLTPGAKSLMAQGEIDRRGRGGCDSPRDLIERPRCTR